MVPSAPRRSAQVVRVLRTMPATLATVAAVLAVGVVWQGLWSSFRRHPFFDTVAYGLPALLDGRWWTPVTGTFFVAHPWVYVLTLASFAGMAYLEFRRGTRVALAYFWIGQLFAIFASALLLSGISLLPWEWAQVTAAELDVGPSGGTLACLAAAIGLLRAPWRGRGWLVLLAGTSVALLFWGSLADLEHALAVGLVLVVDRSLRLQRQTVREQRIVAAVILVAIVVVELLTAVVPTNGVFGPTDVSDTPWIDIAIDAVIVVFVARGLQAGRRWSWVVADVLAVFNVVTTALLLVLVLVVGQAPVEETLGDLSVTVASAALWILMLVYLVRVRGAFRARARSVIGATPAPTVDDVKRMLRADGGGTLSWMTTWGGNAYARTTDGIVAYQRRLGVAIALADPLGPQATRARSVREFAEAAERSGLVPCFFSAGESTRAAAPDGWRSLVVADDTIVDLPGLQFTGKQWAAVRTSMNRAGREDMTFVMTTLSEQSWGVQQQLRAISETWVGDKGLPEMGFTLGTLDEAADPEVRLALAVSPRGDVDGFLSWLPIYGEGGGIRGWTLDLMRRREGGFGPVMEFLIGSSARRFSDDGAEIMSLSGAPLAHEYPPGAGAIAALSERLAEALEPVYGFQSLHRFKEKFHPRYETMYLLFRDESDLPRIGAGLTRAFLPDATLRQFAGAGLELVRGSASD